MADELIIDSHVHLATEAWVEGALGPYRASVEEYFRRRILVRSVEAMAAEYEGAGMVGILLGWDAERASGRPAIPNDLIAAICRRFDDQFVGFGSVDPLRPNAVAELERFPDLGLTGLKVHPTMQAFDPSSDEVMPFFEAAARLQLRIITHAGMSAIGAGRPGGQGLRIDLARPALFDRVAAQFPGVPVMLAHIGAPWEAETIAMALHKSNVYVDISGWKAKYLPASFLREARGRLRNQVCFGSDYPMFDPQEHLSEVRGLDLGTEVNDALMRHNAQRFLGLPHGGGSHSGGPPGSPPL
jgi:predicted TIM-barrel fold metal-dependent hydrolase